MKDYEEIKKLISKVNLSAKKVLKKENLPPNVDLQIQVKNHTEYFKLLNQLKENCKKRNLKIMLLTLVVHHTKTDKLEKSYKILQNASKKLFYSVEWQNFKELVGIRDHIIKLETDFADLNGYHPHLHIILICESYSIAIESFESHKKILSEKYYKLCVSAGMSATSKVKEYMLQHGLNLLSDFEYLAYIADNKKLLKSRVEKLPEKNFSPFLFPIYRGYEKNFKEFVRFMKGKKIFKFSNMTIEGIDFSLKNKPQAKPFTIPDLSVLNTNNYELTSNRKWHQIYMFLPDKLLKHYGYIAEDKTLNRIYKKFKVWLCYFSGIDWVNFYRYIKANCDSDLFSVKRKSAEIPELVQELMQGYENFLSELPASDYLEFVGLSMRKLIEKIESVSINYNPENVKVYNLLPNL